jgi:cell division inhibitor SepF
MGLFEKVKKFINTSEEEYEDYEFENPEGSVAYETKRPVFDEVGFRGTPPVSSSPKESNGNIVDFNSSSSSRPHVVFKKLDRFEDVAGVADVLNEKRIVVLNLETCQPDISRRIIDFLYGVAYANSGELKRIAGRAYIITPYNVPLTGELLDEVESTSFGTTF